MKSILGVLIIAGSLASLFFFIGTLPDITSQAEKDATMKLSGYNTAMSTDWLKKPEKGVVKTCIAFPTNNPMTFVVEVFIAGPNTTRTCISDKPLTNGTSVAIRRIFLTDVSAHRIPFAIPTTESEETVTTSQK